MVSNGFWVLSIPPDVGTVTVSKPKKDEDRTTSVSFKFQPFVHDYARHGYQDDLMDFYEVMADGDVFHSSWSQSGMCLAAHCLLIFDHQDFEIILSLTCSCSIIWCQDWRRNSNIYMRLLNGLYSNRYKEMSVTHIQCFFNFMHCNIPPPPILVQPMCICSWL